MESGRNQLLFGGNRLRREGLNNGEGDRAGSYPPGGYSVLLVALEAGEDWESDDEEASEEEEVLLPSFSRSIAFLRSADG